MEVEEEEDEEEEEERKEAGVEEEVDEEVVFGKHLPPPPEASLPSVTIKTPFSLRRALLNSMPESFMDLGSERNRSLLLLLSTKGLRMFSFGFLSVCLVLYLNELGMTQEDVGLLFTLTLLGDAGISLFMTSHADKYGRKRSLLIGASLSALTCTVFVVSTNFWVLLVAAIFGVISPSGNEVGPFMAIELSALSQVTKDEERTKLMAWYNLVGCFSSALGAVFCGCLLTTMSSHLHYSALFSYRFVFVLYTLIHCIKFIAFSFLRQDIEVPVELATVSKNANPISLFLGLHKSKQIVLKLSLLFILDSFAGSFILQSIITFWFHAKFDTPAATLGTIVFVCNIVAGVSALFAASLADRIGLILTMVVTHLPSNVLTILVPLMPTEALAILILCLRYSISQMDVPTRNAYVQGVVDADERSAANGVTNVVRSLGASTGPFFAGMLYAKRGGYENFPFFIAGTLKIIYDLLLLWSMRSVKPVEEVAKEKAAAAAAAAAAGRGSTGVELSSTISPLPASDEAQAAKAGKR